MTVLVPSYQEDERVVRTTLLSAALQEHPYLRVVLLIDDPPEPKTAHARALLETVARAAGAHRGRARRAVAPASSRRLEHFEDIQMGDRRPSRRATCATLAEHYEFAAGWLREPRRRQEIVDHSDTFFVDHVARRARRRPGDDRRAPCAPAPTRAPACPTDRLLAALPPPGRHVPRRAHQLRAQAVRLARRTSRTRR